eukprot:3329481-Pyramimonas_sp.AAC.1
MARFLFRFVGAVVNRELHNYPGRGWTCWEKGPSWIGLLAIVHGLFVPIYRLFCQLLQDKAGPGGDVRAVRAAAPVADGGAPLPAIADDGGAGGGGGADPGAGAGHHAGDADEADARAAAGGAGGAVA